MLKRLTTAAFLLVLLALTGAVVTVAQEDTGDAPDYAAPLLNILALVPDNETSRNGIAYFLDHAAITAAYPGTERIGSTLALDLISDDVAPGEPGFGQLAWWRIFSNTNSTALQTYLRFEDEWQDSVGFTYFDIDREYYYGTPPAHSLILQGDFDMDAVRDTFRANGYTRALELAGVVWCGEVGCDGGNQVNYRENQPGNPFGGDLGRQQPRALGDDYVMSSPVLENVTAHVAASNGVSQSLDGTLAYFAAVETVTQEGPLIQAWFVDGELMRDFARDETLSILGLVGYDTFRGEASQRPAAIEALLQDFTPLPAYDLMMFADTATDEQHVTYVALVYSDPADAQTAAEVIPARIEQYVSPLMRRPLPEILAERKLDDITTSVVEPVELGPAVMLLRIGTPKPTLEEVIAVTNVRMNPPEMDVTFPGAGFRLLTSMLIQRDLGWLSTVSREFLESQLEE